MQEYSDYLDLIRPRRDKSKDKYWFYRDDTTYPYNKDIAYPDVRKYG
jgi:hypothetical protein